MMPHRFSSEHVTSVKAHLPPDNRWRLVDLLATLWSEEDEKSAASWIGRGYTGVPSIKRTFKSYK